MKHRMSFIIKESVRALSIAGNYCDSSKSGTVDKELFGANLKAFTASTQYRLKKDRVSETLLSTWLIFHQLKSDFYTVFY
jgi:hypothetical protein